MKIQLLQITPNAELLIEKIGRVCYASERHTKEGSARKFIENLLKRGHESVLEHGIATFHISDISRACSHQLVRHRIASYCQRSQRFCKEENFDFYVPSSMSFPATEKNEEKLIIYNKAMHDAQQSYNDLIEQGCKPEDARMVLPNACHTEITTTMNFRELRHFFNMRCDKHAQEEIQGLAKKMLELVYTDAPSCFEDLYVRFIDPTFEGIIQKVDQKTKIDLRLSLLW